MLKIGAFVLGVKDIPRAVAFWSAALGAEPREPATAGWASLRSPRFPGAYLSLSTTERPTLSPAHSHLDLYADDPAAEVERLVSLGAVRAPRELPPDADYVVLEDPDGNPFCVCDCSRRPEEFR
ncbi:MAG: Glyoxalase/Bleomycin resistance protein/Dioxygenase superfamily [Labilithrix sp.]|nr:Glyoxalase/Bleomycin resistance protein/Dioxygenase superfamily [Labilithrix sp.]